MWPYVDHFRGTELIVEHIEKYVCSTITSADLLGGKPFHFKGILGPLLEGAKKRPTRSPSEWPYRSHHKPGAEIPIPLSSLPSVRSDRA